MTAVAEHTASWLEAFTRRVSAGPWEQELREAAFRRFSELGFPTTHDEEWRFTNVAPIARTQWNPGAGPSEAIPEEARVHIAKHAPENAFVALNTAFFPKVVYHHVPKGKVLE